MEVCLFRALNLNLTSRLPGLRRFEETRIESEALAQRLQNTFDDCIPRRPKLMRVVVCKVSPSEIRIHNDL